MLTIPKKTNGQPLEAEKSVLSEMEIFQKVPPEALREIEKKMTEKHFTKQETILLEGDPAERVWFVKEGHVKAMTHAASGRCQTLCMVGSRGMFGSCCVLGGGPYPCHVVAETDVTVISFPRLDFLALLSRYTRISIALAVQLSNNLHQSKDMQTFDQENVEKRILHVLMELTKQFGNTIPLTRREIAEMAGTTVETSIRTFSKFEAEGLLSTARGKIVLKAVKNLAQRMEEI